MRQWQRPRWTRLAQSRTMTRARWQMGRRNLLRMSRGMLQAARQGRRLLLLLLLLKEGASLGRGEMPAGRG